MVHCADDHARPPAVELAQDPSTRNTNVLAFTRTGANDPTMARGEPLDARLLRGAQKCLPPKRAPRFQFLGRPQKTSNPVRARGIVIAVSSLPLGWIALALAIAIIIVAAASASAEVGQLRISRGFGVHYLPLYVMQEKKLLQKRALAAGLDSVEVEYLLIDGGNHINDAVLARSVDIASTGTGGFLTLWAKSKGNQNLEVIGLGVRRHDNDHAQPHSQIAARCHRDGPHSRAWHQDVAWRHHPADGRRQGV